jgi:hypothetical protein
MARRRRALPGLKMKKGTFTFSSVQKRCAEKVNVPFFTWFRRRR